ncbi:MAG TPA: hypothetical protein VNV86_19230 [Candidatus Acidoferrum sp.]|nr:hypothetical protein [Candidatus Acidoferrum sp.]
MGLGGQVVVSSPELEERRALVDRVLASRAFETATRLKDLLRYLSERSESEEPIRENEIGVAVFGRPNGYDNSHDTLVRVQISHLRKKLQQYFESNGRDEAWEILIPKGNYQLNFRAINPSVVLQVEEVRPAPARTGWWKIALVAALAVGIPLMMVTGPWMVQAKTPAAGKRPAVAQLWRDMFGSGQSTYVVLADANLIEFEDAIGHQFTPSEYDSKNFTAFATKSIPDPEKRALVLKALKRPLTSMVDAQAAQRLVLWAAEAGSQVQLVGARDMSLRHIAAQNTILLGSRRADPWVHLFEHRLDFQTVFEEGTPPRAWFANRNPRPGEQAEYRVAWDLEGYCRVAYLPNPKGSGATLLLSGTDLYSSESGADFITQESRVRELRAKFGLKDREKMPPFEVLLRTRLIAAAAPEFEVVAWRRY